ncbi:uncharacterized protein HLK63_F07491 [Nakaseomyces glabratus]|nr:hypothetical protein J6895_01581 [Nakaseomyces glabratus]UCS20284.1 uncharacterized protein GW608_F07491 [Nakaseomyces glabratus]UCS25515.1 uncharacterized protein HLK63_F07491 [Nakaseomyces glabratus]UCS30745.1 uncharacterized protein HLK64_F07491 [Nakaseomyces glabratus]UCS35974.1 uncharacterized protein HLK62_F07491 [Nakaseomyces glabratus]
MEVGVAIHDVPCVVSFHSSCIDRYIKQYQKHTINMQINPRIYSEAQKVAKQPQFKYLVAAMLCAAMVPTAYRRGVTLPHYSQSVLEEVNENIAHKPIEKEKNPSMWGMLKDANKYDLNEEYTYELFSSIM